MNIGHLKVFQIGNKWQVREELITGEWICVAENFASALKAKDWMDKAIKINEWKKSNDPIHQDECPTCGKDVIL